MQAAEIPLMSLSENEDKENQKGSLQHYLKTGAQQTWRLTVASGVLAGFLILLVNVITLAVMYGKFHAADYAITFFTGSCQTTSTVTIVSHIIINVLSTILLATSNYSMQCLASPTRDEVDTAHSKKHWLNIGTPNLRNLYFVSKQKALLWLVLAASSLPLHMFWNSTVFQTRTTNNYLAITVTEDFLHGGQWEIPSVAPNLNSTRMAYIQGVETVPQYYSIVRDLQQKVTGTGSDNSSSELEYLTVE